MTHTELRAILDAFAAKDCPPEVALDACKEEGVWPWGWDTHPERDHLRHHDGTVGARIYPVRYGGPLYRLMYSEWPRRAMNHAGFVVGEVYGPRHELRHLAEVAALYAALPELLESLA